MMSPSPASQKSTGVNIQYANGENLFDTSRIAFTTEPNQVSPHPWALLNAAFLMSCRGKEFHIGQNGAVSTSIHYHLEMCQKVKKLRESKMCAALIYMGPNTCARSQPNWHFQVGQVEEQSALLCLIFSPLVSKRAEKTLSLNASKCQGRLCAL